MEWGLQRKENSNCCKTWWTFKDVLWLCCCHWPWGPDCVPSMTTSEEEIVGCTVGASVRKLGSGPRWKAFQQSNDPKHIPKILQKWMKTKCWRVLKWSTVSVDLNPSENLWRDLAVWRRHPSNMTTGAVCKRRVVLQSSREVQEACWWLWRLINFSYSFQRVCNQLLSSGCQRFSPANFWRFVWKIA